MQYNLINTVKTGLFSTSCRLSAARKQKPQFIGQRSRFFPLVEMTLYKAPYRKTLNNYAF